MRSYSPAADDCRWGGAGPAGDQTSREGTDQRFKSVASAPGCRPARELVLFVAAAGDHGLKLSGHCRTGWRDAVVSQGGNAVAGSYGRSGRGHPGFAGKLRSALANSSGSGQTSSPARAAGSWSGARDPARATFRACARRRYFGRYSPGWKRTALLFLRKTWCAPAKHGIELSPADAQLREADRSAYERAALEAPNFDEVARPAPALLARNGAHASKVLQLLLDAGTLVACKGEMFFHSQAIENLKRPAEGIRRRARAGAADRRGKVQGPRRRFAQICDSPARIYFDREHVTRRAGDKRIIL